MTKNGTKPSQDKPRSGGLDALRLIAAVFVVVYHFADKAPVDPQALFPVLAKGWVATDLFIMLSGFVLGRVYGGGLDAGAVSPGIFLTRRLKRVWPAHLMILAAFVVMVLLTAARGLAPMHPERFDFADLPAEALLINAWGVVDHLSWNAPSWTLSALVICWAALPFLWRAIRPFEGKAAALFMALDVLAITALGSRMVLHASPWHLTLALSLVRALPLFVAGALLARASAGLSFKPGEATLTAIGGAVALGLFVWARPTDISELGVIVSLAFLLLGLNASSLFQAELFRQGGRLSFALFITHSLSGAVWFGAARLVEARVKLDTDSLWLVWLWSLIFAGAVAWAFDRWADAPVQRVLARVLVRKPATVSEAQNPAGSL
jgi:peptidoglycan/LPS O-acetylase OafA/YrhL